MAEPFYLKASVGERFCLYHSPDSATEIRGALVYVHPFAEEMNKSRRMAALQARAFAKAGFAVLQIDLFGCGDSSGDFAEARWEIWKDDVLAATTWLEARTGMVATLWGLRLGALLALDLAANSTHHFHGLLLWQPVINGEQFLTQFLRMRLASDIIGKGGEQSGGTQEMRKLMAAGESLEIAGYELAPALAASVDSLKATDLVVTSMPIHWFELVAESGRPLPPAAARVADAWEARSVDLHRHLVPGKPFWSSQEIEECPALLLETTRFADEVFS
jgi:exosortase A-associated hydrolase 2